jgi:hypothetical protein
MSTSDFSRQIDEALREFHVRSAYAIFETLRSVGDLIDQQPPAVLRAFIEFGREWDRSGRGAKHRQAIRAALLEYVEQRLAAAIERERRLLEGTTGR